MCIRDREWKVLLSLRENIPIISTHDDDNENVFEQFQIQQHSSCSPWQRHSWQHKLQLFIRCSFGALWRALLTWLSIWGLLACWSGLVNASRWRPFIHSACVQSCIFVPDKTDTPTGARHYRCTHLSPGRQRWHAASDKRMQYRQMMMLAIFNRVRSNPSLKRVAL